MADTLQVAPGVVWVRTEDKKTGDAAGFKAMEAELRQQVLGDHYSAWVDEQRKRIPVEVLRADLKGPRPLLTKMLTPQ